MKRYIKCSSKPDKRFSGNWMDRVDIAEVTDDVDLLELYSYDPDCTVRWNVVQNPNTPIDILVRLADDEDYTIRRDVAANVKIPQDVLIKLSDDPENAVLEAVASNPNTPEDILIKLCDRLVQDPSGGGHYVWLALAQNPNTPVTSLKQLATNTQNGYVYSLIRENLTSRGIDPWSYQPLS